MKSRRRSIIVTFAIAIATMMPACSNEPNPVQLSNETDGGANETDGGANGACSASNPVPDTAVLCTTLNNPPIISYITFDPSKFVSFCKTQTVCAEFADPDGDAVEIEWSQLSGAPLAIGPTPGPMQYDSATGTFSQCITLEHAGPGTVVLQAIAFDLLCRPSGDLLRTEDVCEGLGLSIQSRDSVIFPSHGLVADGCACSPVPEICDIIDNDCDGQNNEDLSCACMPLETHACYGGPAGTMGIGNCRGGGRICKLDGSEFESVCLGEVLPVEEKCNGLDDDCDGQTDEGLNNCP